MEVPSELRGSDVRALLGFAGDVAECGDAAQLKARIEALPRLVRSDAVTVIACRDWGGDVELEVGDQAVYRSDLLAAIARGWHDHPVLTRDLERAYPAPRRLSDFTRAREWRRTGLFNDVYRSLGMTRELAVQLAWGPVGSSCCLVLHRDGRDFSERERVVLELAALHLRAARARIAAQAPLARRLALLERGFEHTRGALVVGSGGRVLAAGDHARELLFRWFNGSPAVLPDDLAGWWASVREGSAAPAFEIASGERRLHARLVAGADEDLVILSERGDGPAASELARVLPITPREADVLARLAAGRTNDGIAHDLGISRHTVVRHVERLYTKLDVRTRAAATRGALDALHDFQAAH